MIDTERLALLALALAVPTVGTASPLEVRSRWRSLTFGDSMPDPIV